MRIYLASHYHEHPIMREIAEELKRHDHTITSRWISGDGAHLEGNQTTPLNTNIATNDLDDIDAAEVLLLIGQKNIHGKGTGGRHTEVGYALGRGIPVILVGERENPFQHLVIKADSFSHAITLLKRNVRDLQKRMYRETTPIDVILQCPRCDEFHYDSSDLTRNWTNPPHRSHECQFCHTIWRPSDTPTNGVPAIQTSGASDTWSFEKR